MSATPAKPIIKGIQSVVGFDSVSMWWQADGAYNCSVAYSKNSNLSNGTSILYTDRGPSSEAGYYLYSVNINKGLLPLTKYYYKIMCSASENNSSETEILNVTICRSRSCPFYGRRIFSNGSCHDVIQKTRVITPAKGNCFS